ncbi:MAG: Fur family transcriptional regulator [Syntrophomonadaceae bacterium]|jgi:Fur family ferric uptake transcriptional regulator
MSGFLEKLSAEGYKVTPQRRIIIQVLDKSSKHLSAEEIADQVRKIEQSISVATVYRNINLLVDLGVVSKLDLHNGPARYELNQGHNHHLVCLGCGNAIKLGVCPMQDEIKRVIAENGFEVNSHHFEITGYCRECQVRRQQLQDKIKKVGD